MSQAHDTPGGCAQSCSRVADGRVAPRSSGGNRALDSRGMTVETPASPRARAKARLPAADRDTGYALALAAAETRLRPQRRPLLWLVGGVILGLAVAFVAVGHWRGTVEWQRFRAAAALAQAGADAREPARPVLWGEAQAGKAWPHYERAFHLLSTKVDSAHLASLGRSEGRRIAGVTNTEQVRAGPSAAEVVAAHADALIALRAGAHSTDARRPMDWNAGHSIRIQNLLTARHLANAAVLTAILAVGDGDGERAVQILLDVMQLGRDLTRSPLLIEQMIGCATQAIATSDAVTWANLLRTLDADALRLLAVGLAQLDEAPGALAPAATWISSEAALLANTNLERLTRDRALASQTLSAWRYAFSLRLAMARHGLHQLQLGQQAQTLCAERNTVDLPALDRLFADAVASANPITAMFTPNYSAGLRNHLRAIAALRLLRMAVQHAAGDVVTPLPDPSGGILQWALDAGGNAEFWSDRDPKCARVRVPK